MRVFLAFALQEHIQQTIGKWAQEWQKAGLEGRFAATELYHITIQFLGEVHPEDLEEILSIYRQQCLCWRALSLHISGWGTFGRQRSQLLWAGIQENVQLNTYIRQMQQALRGHHKERVAKKVHPHITVARQITMHPDAQPPADLDVFTVLDTVVLYNSQRKNGRLVYTPLDSVELEAK